MDGRNCKFSFTRSDHGSATQRVAHSRAEAARRLPHNAIGHSYEARAVNWLPVVLSFLLMSAVGLANQNLPIADPPPVLSPWSDPFMTGDPTIRTAVTPNQRNVADGWNHFTDVARLQLQITAHTSNTSDAASSLLFNPQWHATPARAQAALNAMSGEVYATAQTLGLRIADNSLRTVSNRIINTDLFLNEGDSVLLSQQPGDAPTNDGSVAVRGQPNVIFASGWLQGYGSSGSWSSDGNASGSNYSLGGVAYGLDLGRDETGVIGITGGNSVTTFGNDLADRGRINSFQVGLYGLKRFESAYGLAVLNYGRNDYEINRILNIGPVHSNPSSNFQGRQFGGYGEAGLNLDSQTVRIQPFFGLQYISVSNDRIVESGGLGLNVAAATLNTFQSHLGARLIAHRLIDSGGRRWTPYLNGRWVMDLLGDPAAAVASLGGAPGASWVVTGNQPARSLGSIGPGLTVELTQGVSLFANYEYQWGTRFHSQIGSGGLLFTY